jgi:hypothetical protein
VPDEKDDFAELALGDSFHGAYNSRRFRLARSGGSGKKPAPAKVEGEGKKRKLASLPILNASGRQQAAEGAIICETCPIPYRQAEALDTIGVAAEELLREFHREASPWKKSRLLLAYFLMGAPGARRRLPDFLSLGAPNLRVFVRTLGHVMLHAVPRAK